MVVMLKPAPSIMGSIGEANSVPPVPQDVPKAGEVYRHYKSPDQYKVVGLALDTTSDSWVVVYEPLYEQPVAKLFTRPLNEWRQVVEWQGKQVERFAKVD